MLTLNFDEDYLQLYIYMWRSQEFMCLRVTLVIMFLLYSGHSMWPDPLPGQ